ncbi:MAG: exonuclease SbcCD subunit D C-terminal domain-containing protein [Chitinophagales bacterium]
MRILHTADWHLGQRLLDRSRQQEHQLFLDWLLNTLESEKVDALVVAGDIFDVGNPANYALKQYYDFLKKALEICPNIIITGGNHDSVATLDAPKTLMRNFNIHVVGGATKNIEEQIIPIYNAEKQIIAIVLAVPFLRECDMKNVGFGRSYDEREQKIKEGIKAHYHAFVEKVEVYKTQNLPIIATGHLYTAGDDVEKSDVERDIYIGNKARIGSDIFPKIFDYIALGHIHKSQIINKKEHIRYSGSPIPLSFSERNYTHKVLIADFEAGKLAKVMEKNVPLSRKLMRFNGLLKDVKQKITDFETNENELTTWAEVYIKLEQYEDNLDKQIAELAENKNIDILRIKSVHINKEKSLDEQLEAHINLDELTAEEVFIKKMESQAVAESDFEALRLTFKELLELMNNDAEFAVD